MHGKNINNGKNIAINGQSIHVLLAHAQSVDTRPIFSGRGDEASRPLTTLQSHLPSRLNRCGTNRCGDVTLLCWSTSSITVTRFHGKDTLVDSSEGVAMAAAAGLERLKTKIKNR